MTEKVIGCFYIGYARETGSLNFDKYCSRSKPLTERYISAGPARTKVALIIQASLYAPGMPKSGKFVLQGKCFLKPDGGFGGVDSIMQKRCERTRYYAGKTTRNMVL